MTRKHRRVVLSLVIFFAAPRLAAPCSSLVFSNKGFPVFGTNSDNLFAPGQQPRSSGAGPTAARGQQPGLFKPAPADVVRPAGYPSIGKWMLAPDMTIADWLGIVYERKKLREPINVVVIDPLAQSADAAVLRFLRACGYAGFVSRTGHSGGYFGWLGDRLYPQIPRERYHAISDEPFEFHNNHGRFFGPYFSDGRYYFIGALSREKSVPSIKPEHLFVSFNQARDRFARALVEKAGFKLTTFLALGNALLDDPGIGTGDHDGVAVVLTATK